MQTIAPILALLLSALPPLALAQTPPADTPPREAAAQGAKVYFQTPQDGERIVTLRRVGENPIVSTLYRVPAGRHPDYPAIDVLVNILGDVPAGRLHRALVQKGLASAAWGAERGLHDPGFVYFGATLPGADNLAAARDTLVEVVESVALGNFEQAEFELARTELLKDFERVLLDTPGLVRALS